MAQKHQVSSLVQLALKVVVLHRPNSLFRSLPVKRATDLLEEGLKIEKQKDSFIAKWRGQQTPALYYLLICFQVALSVPKVPTNLDEFDQSIDLICQFWKRNNAGHPLPLIVCQCTKADIADLINLRIRVYNKGPESFINIALVLFECILNRLIDRLHDDLHIYFATESNDCKSFLKAKNAARERTKPSPPTRALNLRPYNANVVQPSER